MGVVGDQSGSHTAGEDVNGDTERNEETSRNSVHAGEVGNGSGTPQNEHSGNDDVSRKGKEQKDKVSSSAPSSLDNFKVGMAEGSVLLKLAGDHGKEKNLDGSTGSVPPRSTDAEFVCSSTRL